MNFENFIENIVDLYCTLNIIHPFREGNGRTQRIFISQLIRYNGYDINFSDIDSDYLMIATIQSAQGFTDNLSDIFRKHIIKPQKQRSATSQLMLPTCFYKFIRKVIFGTFIFLTIETAIKSTRTIVPVKYANTSPNINPPQKISNPNGRKILHSGM